MYLKSAIKPITDLSYKGMFSLHFFFFFFFDKNSSWISLDSLVQKNLLTTLFWQHCWWSGSSTSGTLQVRGNSLVLWIQQVCSAIVELEAIPNVLKMGVVNPIYKGNGRDPLDTNSYRGITLSPVLSKTLELLLLGRFQAILSAPVFPRQNQTGFVKKTSCTDAIFSSYEILSRLAR